jgi:hypothetical protein
MMSKRIPRRAALTLVLALVCIGAGCGGSATSPSAKAAAAAAASPTCDATLLTHVYDPGRLTVLTPCMTVTGTIDNVPHASDDGDLDFHFVPDPQFAHLLNSFNNGHLHVEAICQAAVQSDTPQAAQSCGAFKGSVVIPPPGTRASVSGPYVLDTNHGWTEIHPVTSIIKIQ